MNTNHLLFLLGQTGLHLLLVEQLAAVFELKWQLLLQNLSVLLDLLGVSIFQGAESLGILLLGLEQVLIPLLVELLILLDMGLFALLLLLRLVENQFLQLLLVVLVLELLQSLLSHFSLNVLALGLTVVAMLVQNLPKHKIMRAFGFTYMYS